MRLGLSQNAGVIADYFRVIWAGQEDALLFPSPAAQQSDSQVAESGWNKLPMLTKLFKFRDFDVYGEGTGLERGLEFWRDADYITQAIKDLAKL